MAYGVATSRFQVETAGREDVVDITDRVAEGVASAGVTEGLALVFALHTTVGLTIIECEPGLLEDFREAWRRIVPREIEYRHNRIDDNGHSHIRASLLGPSLTLPVSDGRIELGTWQRIVLLEFDPHPKTRHVVIKTIGECAGL